MKEDPVATAPGTDSTQYLTALEIEFYSKPNLPGSHGAGGDEELIEEGLSLCRGRGWTKRVEVDELAAETEDRGVKHVVEFNAPAHAHLLVKPELARDIQIENKLTGASAGVPGQIS